MTVHILQPGDPRPTEPTRSTKAQAQAQTSSGLPPHRADHSQPTKTKNGGNIEGTDVANKDPGKPAASLIVPY